MSRDTILIVDDDEDIRALLHLHLTHNGFNVCRAANGSEALDVFESCSPDLIILDVMLGRLDGFDVCLELRKRTEVPIIFLSAKEEATDKIAALRLGADDYMTKPFHTGELVARVKAHLRRSRITRRQKMERDVKTVTPAVLQYPGLKIDLNRCDVQRGGQSVALSAKEYQLLTFLAQNPEHVYTLEQLFQTVWDSYSYGDKRTVIVHISNLRKKIEPDPANPIYIVTVRGMGYKFNGFEQDAAST